MSNTIQKWFVSDGWGNNDLTAVSEKYGPEDILITTTYLVAQLDIKGHTYIRWNGNYFLEHKMDEFGDDTNSEIKRKMNVYFDYESFLKR